jgi:hypothetical protein
MKTKFQKSLLASALMCMIAFGTGCATKNDAVAQAEKAEKNAPGIEETKAIAEQGFIYGLPIVMNYAVMYAYAVDQNSGQFKAPFNSSGWICAPNQSCCQCQPWRKIVTTR